LVDANEAINLLNEHNKLAATWWLNNTPYLFKTGSYLLFDPAACRVVDDAGEPVA
jgi:hypothetical protein